MRLLSIALALLFSATAFAQGLVKTDSVVGKGREAVSGATVVVVWLPACVVAVEADVVVSPPATVTCGAVANTAPSS
mgnify:CR=1 FL=1